MHVRSDGALPPSSTRTAEPKRESISNKPRKVLIDHGSLLSLLRTIYQSADETTRQMRSAQWLATMNTHNPSFNMSTTHSNTQGNQEREEIPQRLEEVNLEDISIHFLCIYSTHPNWKQIVSSRNEYGQTMAHISVTLGYIRLLQHLSTWQIDLNIVDHMGSTPLHYAYLFIQEDCARLLIASGAEPFILDNLGRSPSSLNPSLEARLHPSVENSGDSSISSADFTIEMPEEAEGLYAKDFLVQQWTRGIEDERMSEVREISSPRSRRNDVWGHLEAAGTAPINHSADEKVVLVVERQPFSSTVQSPQGIPTLVAPQQMETISDSVAPSDVPSTPVGTSDQAKMGSPRPPEFNNYDPANAIPQNHEGVGLEDTAAGNARSLSTANPQEGRDTLKVPFSAPGTPTAISHTTQPPLTPSIREISTLTQDIRQPSDVIQKLEPAVSHRVPLGGEPYLGPVEVVSVNPSDIIGPPSPSPVPEDGSPSKRRKASLKELLLPAEHSPRVPQPNVTEKAGTQVDPTDESCGFVGVNQLLEENGGDSSTLSADFTIEMPEEAEGPYAKDFLVQQWTRGIEDERMSEVHEMSSPRPQRNDVLGHLEVASTAPINHSADERVGRVVDRQSFSSNIQSPQGIPTLVAPQQVETISDSVVPSGVLSPPAGSSDQAKMEGPRHPEFGNYNAPSASLKIYERVASQGTAASTAKSLFRARETANPQEGRDTLKAPISVPATPTARPHTTPPLTSPLISKISTLTRQPPDVAKNLETFASHQAPLSGDSYSVPVGVMISNPSDIIGSPSPSSALQGGGSPSKHRKASLRASLLPAERSPRVLQPTITEKTGTQVDPTDESCGFVGVNQLPEVQEAMRDLVAAIRASQFFIDNKLEPRLGTSDAVALMAVAPDGLWRGFGTKESSIYSLFIKDNGRVFKCLWCGDVQDMILQHAIGHVRATHLGHEPFLCGGIHVGNKIW